MPRLAAFAITRALDIFCRIGFLTLEKRILLQGLDVHSELPHVEAERKLVLSSACATAASKIKLSIQYPRVWISIISSHKFPFNSAT